MLSRASSCITVALVLALGACGDSGGTSGTGGGGQGGSGSGGGTTSTGGGGGGPTCEPPAPSPGAEDLVTVDTALAVARDETGATIQNFDFQLCGVNGCLYATTNMLGQASFTNNLSSAEIDRPIFKPGDSLTYGKIGYHLTATSPSPLPGVFPTMTDSGDAFAAGASLTAAGAKITLPADGVAVVDELIYDDAPKQTFRAGALDVDDVDAATETTGEFSMVYALGPVDTLFCPPAQLTVDNYAGLPANTAVEFWGNTLSVGEEFGGYGAWVKLSDGVVSADGATVSTTEGQGLPVLVTVAIKAL